MVKRDELVSTTFLSSSIKYLHFVRMTFLFFFLNDVS